MRLGIAYPNIDKWLEESLPLKIAQKAEELGYEVFLTYDHYMLPFAKNVLEAWIFLTYIAAKTEKIRVGTVVTPMPFRPPGMLAKMVASLDYLSGGRTILGVGAGWHQPEFEAFSKWAPPGERVNMTEEGLQLILELWMKPVVNFRGKYYKAVNAVVEPKLLQKPHPPLWFGTTGKRMLRLAAKYGDGWIPGTLEPEEFVRYKEYLDTQREKYGTTGKKFVYAIFYSIDSDIEEHAEKLAALRDLGLEIAVLDLRKIEPENALKFLEEAHDNLRRL